MRKAEIQSQFTEALRKGQSVMLYLDTRYPECRVHEVDPKHPWKYALRFTPSGPHRVSERGIESELVFRGMPRRVFVPWRAVYGVQIGQEPPVLWEYAFPFEIMGHPPINVFSPKQVWA